MKIPVPLPVFAVNLKSRNERREHIQKEFDGREEFVLTIVDAEEDQRGAMGLWRTLCKILRSIPADGHDLIVFCEDDHTFTPDYSPDLLLEGIEMGRNLGADIVLGGVSWFSGALQVTNELFWVDRFSGLQFTVIYRKFFSTILDAFFGMKDVADFKIAALSEHKYFLHPFISTQREFGYSDATGNNNVAGHVDSLFRNSIACADSLAYIAGVYRGWSDPEGELEQEEAGEELPIPTYVLHSSDHRGGRSNHIEAEFAGRKEFGIVPIKASGYPATPSEIFLDIRKIVGMADSRGEDVIIICQDDHHFTEHYSREYLVRNIIAAYSQNAEIVSGGVDRFDQVVPVTDHLFWINSISGLQFVVLFKSVFRKILDEPLDEIPEMKDVLTQVTSHKMVLHPFVSVKAPAELPAGSPAASVEAPTLQERFQTASSRLDLIRRKREVFLNLPIHQEG